MHRYWANLVLVSWIVAGIPSLSRWHLQAQEETVAASLHGSPIEAVTVGSSRVEKSDLALTRQPVEVETVTLAGRADETLIIAATSKTVHVFAEEFCRFQLTIPPTNRVEITSGPHFLELTAPEENIAQLKLHFPDGAEGTISPGGSGAFDVFPDCLYYFAGHGAATVSADGQQETHNCYSMPLAGGPIEAQGADDPLGRLHRRTPLADVVLHGDLGGTVDVRADRQTLPLHPGDELEIELENGGELNLVYRADARFIAWEVRRGLVTIEVEEIENWKVIGRRGQKGEIQWERRQRLIDLINTSGGANSLTVLLPNFTRACVDPGATFQFGSLGPASFMTTSAGGRVAIYNLFTFVETVLPGDNLVFVGGRPRESARDLSTLPFERVMFSWDLGAPLQFSSSAVSATMTPNSEKLFSFRNDGRISVEYREGGDLLVTALEGNFRLEVASLNGLQVDLPQGNAVTLMLDAKKGTFLVATPTDNVRQVTVNTPSGYNPSLPGNTALNFNMGRDGSMAASSKGKIVFFEGAGAGTLVNPASVQSPTLVNRDDIDSSRIPQPPASPSTSP